MNIIRLMIKGLLNEIRDKYNELYRPIAEERKIRNREINKEEQELSLIHI